MLQCVVAARYFNFLLFTVTAHIHSAACQLTNVCTRAAVAYNKTAYRLRDQTQAFCSQSSKDVAHRYCIDAT
jgi:hypothetical protein